SHGNRVRLARNGKAVDRFHLPPRSSGDRRLSHGRGDHVRRDQSGRGPHLHRARSARAPFRRGGLNMSALDVAANGEDTAGLLAGWRDFSESPIEIAALGLVALLIVLA